MQIALHMPDVSFEKNFSGVVAGVDEAGRGPWAGPVVAAAVILNLDDIPSGINDSKKLSEKKRECLFPVIKEKCCFGIGIVDEKIIDEINILEATKLAMIQAVANLSIRPGMVLVDGNHTPDFGCRSQAIIGGDSKSLSIAAASIIAKVTRDRIMQDLHKLFPQYGWDRNAGYGTRIHQEGLAKFGPSPYHRTSFAPIRKILENV